MGIIGTVARLAGRDPALEHRLYIDGALQHQRHQISEEYNAPKEEQKRAEAAAKEARAEWGRQQKIHRDELGEQEKAAWALWALEPRYTGGIAEGEPMLVLHHRAGKVPVLILPPRGGNVPAVVSGPEELVRANPDRRFDERFMEKAVIADGLYSEVRKRYGPMLASLRDGVWWREMCVAAGVSDKRTDPYPWTGQYASGKETITTFDIPRIAGIRIAADGLRVRIAGRLGDTPERWTKALPALRTALRGAGAPPGEITIGADGGDGIVIRFGDADPLEGVVPTTGAWDDEKMRSLFGIDAQGREVWINWRNASGMVVGGLAGSGKTASMLPVFAGFEDNAELYVFDGKAQRDLHPLRHLCRVYDNSGDISAPLKTLEMLETLRVLRGDALYEKLNAPNFWNLSTQQRRQLGMKPIFVILDEAQVWLKPPTDKVRKAISARVLECVENLIRMGRSAGIVVIITTQRPSAVSIPTDVRDNAQLKLCFKVTDSTMATMVLGSSPTGPLDPAAIPTGKKGRFVMDTEGVGMVLGQAGYIEPEELEARLATAVPVPDQWQVAEAFAGGLRPGMTRPDAPAPVVTTPAPAAAEEPKTEPEPAAEPEAAPAPSSVAELSDALSAAELAAIASLLAKMRGGAEPAGTPEAPDPEPTQEAEPEPSPTPTMTKPPTKTKPTPKPQPAAPVNDTPAF